jgi:hypothetical protein
MTREIRLPSYSIIIRLDRENTAERPGCGSISSDLERICCPVCGDPTCNTCWCGSQDEESGEDANDVVLRLRHNGALDGLEALILAHACGGIDVTASAYLEGIETAVDAVANQFT